MAQPGNEWGDPTFCDDATLIDARLTERGLEQVQEELLPKFTSSSWKEQEETNNNSDHNYLQLLQEVDLVIVSPLTRTQETFQYGVLPALEKLYADNNNNKAMPPILAHPLSTERVYTASDTGRSVTELSQEFPWVDWSLLEESPAEQAWWYSHATLDEETVANYQEWRPHQEGQWYAVPGEPQDHFQARMKRLEEWIAAREERTILLVVHWGVVRYLTGGYSADNCEVKVLDQWIPLHQREDEEDNKQ